METTRQLVVVSTNRFVTAQQCRGSSSSNKRRQVVKLISSPQLINRRLSTVCRWQLRYNNNNNKTTLTLVSVLVASLALLTALTSTTTANSLVYANPHQQAATNDKTSAAHNVVVANNNQAEQQQQQRQLQRSDLEAELNSIVQQQQQQQETLDGNNKLLAEAIISHLMLDNINAPGMTSSSSSSSSGNGADLETDLQAIVNANDELLGSSESVAELAPIAPGEQVSLAQQTAREPNALEAQRLRKLLSFLRNYEAGSYLNSAQSFSPFPLLPSGQAATMKRAAAKMNAYLQTPSQQRHLSGGVQSYGRNSFDFGLGKRPDSSIAGNILRFGDSSMGVNGGSGSIQPVGSFGKRPSAQRYDFGLGKRVANPAYPRYDFGLGKRAPNRIRYDFGLGK